MNNPYFIVEKVGMDTETSYNKYPEFQVWEEGKLAGIKEVVEWGKETCPHCIGITYHYKRVCDTCWQSKLKEWGCLT